MLNEKNLPNYFWVEAVATIVYIMNRTPIATICEELLHTFTTKICTHNKNSVGSGTTMYSLTSKVVQGK
jgi:hypothetical protein